MYMNSSTPHIVDTITSFTPLRILLNGGPTLSAASNTTIKPRITMAHVLAAFDVLETQDKKKKATDNKKTPQQAYVRHAIACSLSNRLVQPRRVNSTKCSRSPAPSSTIYLCPPLPRHVPTTWTSLHRHLIPNPTCAITGGRPSPNLLR